MSFMKKLTRFSATVQLPRLNSSWIAVGGQTSNAENNVTYQKGSQQFSQQ